MHSTKSHLFTWDWRCFVLVAASALPIPIAAIFDPNLAFAMAIGLIPAAFAGVGPTRKSRLRILFLGVLIPLCLISGTLLSTFTNAPIAGIALALLGFFAAFMLLNKKMIWLNLVAPIVAIGLSFTDLQTILGFTIIMLAQSLVAFVVSLFFPQRPPTPAPQIPPISKTEAITFGVLYGVALLSATLISWGWDHMGWVVGSTGLVMRPTQKMEGFRSAWRALSILGGLVVVSAFLLLQPPLGVAVAFAIITMALCGGMNKSQAYIMPFFMTICIFMMLEYPIGGTDVVWQRFIQRLFDASLGIIIGGVFGLVIPEIIGWIQKVALPMRKK